jgi:hypothetical protein
MNSAPFRYLVTALLARITLAQSYELGLVQQTPVPALTEETGMRLAAHARRAWSLKRALDTPNEISHAFVLPASLIIKVTPDGFYPAAITAQIATIQRKIDDEVSRAYSLDEEDRAAVDAWDHPTAATTLKGGADERSDGDECEQQEDEADDASVANSAGLLSWAVGVAFGRFDIRLATNERPLPPEPGPFDPLPRKSPGMLPDGDSPFHSNPGILVDDPGHPHDLPHLIDSVLDYVGMDSTLGTRAWLRRDFFPEHLKQYSKSRRKAPIYWPLSTASGGYTLLIYYPALTDQTLFVAANDFVGTKLDREVEPALRALRQKTDRSREEERTLEDLQTLHDELSTLRAELLRLAPTWKPNHDDGVQITAAPLWRLFRHRPWQAVLRDTWEKLEQGTYDWAHLAMDNWPGRVLDKCRTDKSLAIAHDLEHLYEPPPEAPGKARRGRRKKG